MIKTLLKVTNPVTNFMRKQNATVSNAFSKAIVSAGYELRASLKGGMKKEAPGGDPWEPTSPWTKYRLLTKANRAYKRRTEKEQSGGRKRKRKVTRMSLGAPKTALSKLAGATRLKKRITGGGFGTTKSTNVEVGFLNSSSAKWAHYHQTGPHYVPVSPRMRRMIFASGLIITAGRIKIPRRRTTEIVYERNKATIPVFADKKVEYALLGKDPRSVKMKWH